MTTVAVVLYLILLFQPYVCKLFIYKTQVEPTPVINKNVGIFATKLLYLLWIKSQFFIQLVDAHVLVLRTLYSLLWKQNFTDRSTHKHLVL